MRDKDNLHPTRRGPCDITRESHEVRLFHRVSLENVMAVTVSVVILNHASCTVSPDSVLSRSESEIHFSSPGSVVILCIGAVPHPRRVRTPWGFGDGLETDAAGRLVYAEPINLVEERAGVNFSGVGHVTHSAPLCRRSHSKASDTGTLVSSNETVHFPIAWRLYNDLHDCWD